MQPKTLVIGLDGVPCTLLEEYMGKGLLPNIERILSGGHVLKQMDASIPDVSSTSWTSFFTGANPGEHGIFGFMELAPGTYRLSFPSYEDVAAPSIWEIIGNNTRGGVSGIFERYGKRFDKPLRSIVLNIPQTFPARPMNGMLTAGFVCPDFKRGTYPDSLHSYLTSIGYIPDIDSNRAVDEKEAFFKEIFTSLERREQAYAHLLENGQWDLFVGVVTETDRMHHFFFDAARDCGHPHHGDFIACYKRIDEMIGRLYDRFMEMTGGEGLFMTMSDHGFTVIEKEVYLNAWLRRNGFLKLDPAREFFDQIDTGSRAFCMDPARIYINVEGKYPRGPVSEAGRDAVAREIKAGLESLKDAKGRPVIKAVYGKDALYTGARAGRGPDLVCVSHDGFDLKGNLKREEVFGNSHFRGMHTRHDAHCILPAGADLPERLHIENLAPLILDNLAQDKRGLKG